MLAIPVAAHIGSDVHFEWLVERAAQEGKRLTIMAVLLTHEGDVGAGRQNNDEENWSLIQGQVEKEEGVVSALWRELNDELGLRPEHIKGDAQFLFAASVSYPPHRVNDDFPNGKLYACFGALLAGQAPRELAHNKEMINWAFIDPFWAKTFCIFQPHAKSYPEETKYKGEKIIGPAIDATLLRFGFPHLVLPI